LQEELEFLALRKSHEVASSSRVDISSNIIPAFPQGHNATVEYSLKTHTSTGENCHGRNGKRPCLSSKLVLTAEVMITSTSLAISSAKSSSNPRLDSQTFPTTGTSLLNIKDW